MGGLVVNGSPPEVFATLPATLHEATTPVVLLDRQRVKVNAERMLEHARRHGVALRPHMKTLKSIEVARLALDARHGGIAVSTLNEAAYFARHGLQDIQLAVCQAPAALPRIAEVGSHCANLSFFIDSVEMAEAVTGFTQATGAQLNVWIEIDSGGRRTGVEPDDPCLLPMAAALGPLVRLCGVATHAGQSYANQSALAIADIAETERAAVVHAAQRLRAGGFSVAGVSAGSTPGVVHSRSAAGLTEWRPGVYLAGDLFQVAVGSLRVEDIAVSVLATVISHQRARGEMIIDAGALALSLDRSTQGLGADDAGYGLVTDLLGRASYGHLRVDAVYQEHGKLREVSAAVFAALPVGSRVRIIPNHGCMTAAMYNHYLVTEGGEEIVACWSRTNGWS